MLALPSCSLRFDADPNILVLTLSLSYICGHPRKVLLSILDFVNRGRASHHRKALRDSRRGVGITLADAGSIIRYRDRLPSRSYAHLASFFTTRPRTTTPASTLFQPAPHDVPCQLPRPEPVRYKFKPDIPALLLPHCFTTHISVPAPQRTADTSTRYHLLHCVTLGLSSLS